MLKSFGIEKKLVGLESHLPSAILLYKPLLQMIQVVELPAHE